MGNRSAGFTYMSQVPGRGALEPGMEISQITSRMEGFAPADLEAICQAAKRFSLTRVGDSVGRSWKRQSSASAWHLNKPCSLAQASHSLFPRTCSTPSLF
jgi:hypothetical protein